MSLVGGGGGIENCHFAMTSESFVVRGEGMEFRFFGVTYFLDGPTMCWYVPLVGWNEI